jgi:hypothetical protein
MKNVNIEKLHIKSILNERKWDAQTQPETQPDRHHQTVSNRQANKNNIQRFRTVHKIEDKRDKMHQKKRQAEINDNKFTPNFLVVIIVVNFIKFMCSVHKFPIDVRH